MNRTGFLHDSRDTGFQPMLAARVLREIRHSQLTPSNSHSQGLRTRVTRQLLLPLALGLVIVGCNRAKVETQPATQASYRTGTAIIRGTVMLSGKPPTMATIPNQPCHDGATPLTEETVVTDDSCHLQNVIVYLEDAPPASPVQNLPPVALDQINCHYVPHVLALRTGQSLHVTTRDPTLHNVHGMCSENEPFNFALVAAGQSRDIAFPKPELFSVRCDVHPWMKAYVEVFNHPWFALTDKNGQFQIANVPSGTYTLATWQEKYGILRQTVKIDDGKVVDASFSFQSGL